MVPEVTQTLDRLSRREHFTADDDLVFPGQVGDYLDWSALRRRFVAAQKRAACDRSARLGGVRVAFNGGGRANLTSR